MKRVIVWYSIMSLLLGIMGCCGDDDDNKPPKLPCENEHGLRLCDNSYWSNTYSVTISKLPSEGWTGKELGEDGKGRFLYTENLFEGVYVTSYGILLFEHVPTKGFIEPESGKDRYYLEALFDEENPVIYNPKVPFIYAEILSFKGIDMGIIDEQTLINMSLASFENVADTTSFEIEKSTINVNTTSGTTNGTQAIYSYRGMKFFETTFLFNKNTWLYINYCAPVSEFNNLWC